MVELKMIGRLTKDVVKSTVKTENGSKTRAVLSIAAKNRGHEDTTFFDVIVWEKKADAACNYLAKGDMVYVSATMRNNNYEKDGVKFYSYEITATELEFLSTKKRENLKGEEVQGNVDAK